MKHLRKFEGYNTEINKRFEYEQEYGTRKKGEWIFEFREDGNHGCLKDITPIIINTHTNDLDVARDIAESELTKMLGDDWINKLVNIKPILGRFVIERFFKWKPRKTWEEYNGEV